MEQSAGKAANSGTLIDAVMANIRQRIAAKSCARRQTAVRQGSGKIHAGFNLHRYRGI